MSNENNRGYEIKRAVLFENDRGFALGENAEAPQTFVTWQFTEENGVRDYYWGHYNTDGDAANRDYLARVSDYQHEYGLLEKGAFKYYSTQRPVDIATFPKTDHGPIRFVNFDTRESVESGNMQAWGYLIYDAPLTYQQIKDYELRAAPDNPDILRLHYAGVDDWDRPVYQDESGVYWKDVNCGMGVLAFHSAVNNDFYGEPDMPLRKAFDIVVRVPQQKKSVSDLMKEGAEQAAKDNAARQSADRQTPPKKGDIDLS